MHKGTRDEVKKLLILGMMEQRILRLSKKLILGNLSYTDEDTAQDFRIKVLDVCKGYHASPAKDIIAICCKSITHDAVNKIRRNTFIQKNALMVDLSAAVNMHSVQWISETYADMALDALLQVLHPVERDILQAVICQDAQAFEFISAYCEYVHRPMHTSVVALQKYFGYRRRDIEQALSCIRKKIPEAVQSIPDIQYA